MSSRIESFELRNPRDKHAPQDDLPPPYTPHPPGVSRSSLLLGLYILLPALATVSAVTLGLKASAAAKSAGGGWAGQWLDQEGIAMSQWPGTLFPNQDELPLAVAALALATAAIGGVLLLLVVRSGPLPTSFSKRLAVLVHVGLTTVVALAGTIHAFVLNDRSTGFDITYAMTAVPESPGTFTYNKGRFSREAWACTVSALPHFDADLGGAMSRACAQEMSSRWLVLFTFLLSAGLFSLLYLDSRGGRHFMQ